METIPHPVVTLGMMLGRGQAFGLLANQSLVAQAECLLKIRDSGVYKITGHTWEQFCPEFVGMSRQAVEALLANLQEFGANYVRLSEIVRISPDTYRRLEPKISGEQIEIEGEMVDIAPENAARIRQAVVSMRSQLQETQKQKDKLDARMSAGPWMANLKGRIDDNLQDLHHLAECVRNPEQITLLRELLQSFGRQLQKVSRELDDTERVIREKRWLELALLRLPRRRVSDGSTRS